MSPAGISRGEVLRKLVHMSVGAVAFGVRFLGPLWSAVGAVVAIAFNLLVLPRIGGRRLWRQAETERGGSLGIVLYPVAVLLLILAFHRRLEVAAAIWGVLAFGDGMASVVGMTLGRSKLPWNARKSWAGSLAYVVFGGAAAVSLLLWTAPGRYGLAFAAVACLASTLLAAALESLPQGLDDNIGVPLVSGLLLYGLLLTQGRWQLFPEPAFLHQLAIGLVVNLAFAAAGWFARGVDASGALAGIIVGTAVYACLGWRGYVVLLAFFVLGTAATKLGYARKAAAKLAQEKGGRRSARHALANTAVAAVCAVLATRTEYWQLFTLAFVAAFATKTSDTMASEIGQLYGRRTFLITTLRPVPRGTEGAVSLEGTLAGVAGSLLIAGLGLALGFYGVAGVAWVALAAFVATTLESLVGATLERQGLLDNEAVNFLNTLVGALVAMAAALVGARIF
jgi:uncharacterized protein (TIGR00297 family)